MQEDPRLGELLDAAVRLLTRGERPSVATVAAEAGVSRATAHRRLGGSPGLFTRLAELRGLDLPERTRPDARTRVLDAVGEYLKENALIGVSLEDVARRAGVGPATLYRIFTDREGLLRAFMDERGARRHARRLDPALPARPQLIALVEEGIRFLTTHRGLLMLGISPSPDDKDLVAAVGGDPASTRASLAHFLAATTRSGALRVADPELAAMALSGAMLAGVLLTERDPAVVAPALVDGFLKGWVSPRRGAKR